MKKKLSRILASLLATIMIVGLTGCGGDFDAKGYVKAYLDALYKQEYKSYAEFTDQTVEEAEEQVLAVQREEVEDVYSALDLTDEDFEEYFNAAMEINKIVSYEVIEAKKDDDGNFVVTLEIQPVDVFQQFNEGLMTKMEETFAEATEIPDDKTLMDFTLDYMKECSANASYGETETIELSVTRDDDNVYTISESDLLTLEEALMPQ